MEITYERILVEDVMNEKAIGQWIKPKDFDLSIVDIHIPVFKFTLNVVYGSFEEFKRFMVLNFDHKIEHTSARAMYLTFEHKGTRWNWINIQSIEWTAEDYGTIAHEIHHFVHFALSEMGCVYGNGGEEVYAYTLGHTMELFLRAFMMLRKTLLTAPVV